MASYFIISILKSCQTRLWAAKSSTISDETEWGNTLPSDPQDPASWNNHVAGVKIDKSTTILSSVINGMLEEKQCLKVTEHNKTDEQKQEQALATLEQAACSCGKPYITKFDPEL